MRIISTNESRAPGKTALDSDAFGLVRETLGLESFQLTDSRL
jgi:hypothetical protein